LPLRPQVLEVVPVTPAVVDAQPMPLKPVLVRPRKQDRN
jgi:hypothetical protein